MSNIRYRFLTLVDPKIVFCASVLLEKISRNPCIICQNSETICEMCLHTNGSPRIILFTVSPANRRLPVFILLIKKREFKEIINKQGIKGSCRVFQFARAIRFLFRKRKKLYMNCYWQNRSNGSSLFTNIIIIKFYCRYEIDFCDKYLDG